ncbi:uncharacterized protein [Clytia hemisphaerica]
MLLTTRFVNLLKFNSKRSCMRYACAYYHVKSGDELIDLKSDTVTKPCDQMLTKMFQATVGDDVFREDPTTHELELKAAEMFGKEKALFAPSGTMGNLLCILAHCQGRSQELIIGTDQHVYFGEQGHFMQYGGIVARPLPNQDDGSLRLEGVEKIILRQGPYHCKTSMLVLENTHMVKGGIPLRDQYLQDAYSLCKKYDVKLHIDGARLLGAAIATGNTMKEILRNADSVSMCLSKGMGCPVGCVIGGSEELIDKALHIRKSLGGGMRQIGYLTAAGIYALENAHQWIEIDHQHARAVADNVNSLGFGDSAFVNTEHGLTSIVFIELKDSKSSEIVHMLRERYNIEAMAFTDKRVRLCMHRNISSDDIDYVNKALSRVLELHISRAI